MSKICKQCKRKIYTNNKVFCSKECRGISQRKRVKIECRICGIMFERRKIEVNVKYCSIKCRDVGRYKNTHRTGSCKICKNEFITYKKNKKQFCGWECQQEWNKLPENIKKRVNKSKNAIYEKYGVNYYFQTAKFKEKSKQSTLDRYGDENYRNVDKSRKTKLERYGDENYNNMQKHKQTCLERYGVDNFAKTNEFRKSHGKLVIKKLINDKNFNEIILPLFSIDEYTGITDYYKFQCKKCLFIFTDHLNNGKIPRCTVCYPLKSTSIAEKEVLEYIKELLPSENIIENDRIILSGKELDIYLPDKKIAIEYNGLHWHSELNGKDKKYHLNKTIECNKAGIRLIQLFEDEWINKQFIVKDRLRHILGVNSKIIYARKCNISEISPSDKNDFLNEVHIQGQDKSSVKLGAYYNDELVSVMTFSKKRIALGSRNVSNFDFELSRFAVKYKITGIANRLLKHFIKNYNPKSIISYSDIRWNTGNLYEQLGFTKISDGSPGYWYIVDDMRKHRFNFRKSILKDKLKNFNSNLTEWENMQIAGYDRIWDCGHLKYEMVL